MKKIGLGIAGYGTVARGVVETLAMNAATLLQRTGIEVSVVSVGARRGAPDLEAKQIKVSRDIFAVICDSDVDICVELMGGIETAKAWIEAAIDAGKPVVTANKALIAEYGSELLAKASDKGVPLLFEASVAGGIPILKALREGLVANQIAWVAGIINGTGNYILTEMQKDRSFETVLQEAQQLGYAEADPTFDVEGIDAAHKLTILASLSFGMPLSWGHVFIEGISALHPDDLNYADTLGYRVKHLGMAHQSDEGVQLRVHPTLIPKDSLLAKVDGVMNAVMVQTNAVGSTLFYGPGAGGKATASAVLADVIEVARVLESGTGHCVPALAFREIDPVNLLPIDQLKCGYYLRIQVTEAPGVLAHITQLLSVENISIDAIVQKPVHCQTGLVSIIILTQPVQEKVLNQVIDRVESLPQTGALVIKIRVDTLGQEL